MRPFFLLITLKQIYFLVSILLKSSKGSVSVNSSDMTPTCIVIGCDSGTLFNKLYSGKLSWSLEAAWLDVEVIVWRWKYCVACQIWKRSDNSGIHCNYQSRTVCKSISVHTHNHVCSVLTSLSYLKLHWPWGGIQENLWCDGRVRPMFDRAIKTPTLLVNWPRVVRN